MSDIYLSLTETPSVVTLSQPVVSGVLNSTVTVANVVSVNVVTMPAITVQAAAPAVTTVAGTVTANNLSDFYDGANDWYLNRSVPFVEVSANEFQPVGINNNVPISGTVTVGNSVTIGSLPAISGTVTVGSSVTIGSLPAISGTVTANVQGTITAGMLLAENAANNFPNQYSPVQLSANPQGGSLRVRLDYNPIADAQPNSNSVIGRTDVSESGNNAYIKAKIISGTVTIGSLPAISGTVTANSIFPRVTLIDGSGTVTTANTAITVFASSSTRSYLLVQVTTGSAFVNVGATATTVNGINLTAGQGYAWETTIPQGIVSLISTTTSSCYVAKEA